MLVWKQYSHLIFGSQEDRWSSSIRLTPNLYCCQSGGKRELEGGTQLQLVPSHSNHSTKATETDKHTVQCSIHSVPSQCQFEYFCCSHTYIRSLHQDCNVFGGWPYLAYQYIKKAVSFKFKSVDIQFLMQVQRYKWLSLVTSKRLSLISNFCSHMGEPGNEAINSLDL